MKDSPVKRRTPLIKFIILDFICKFVGKNPKKNRNKYEQIHPHDNWNYPRSISRYVVKISPLKPCVFPGGIRSKGLSTNTRFFDLIYGQSIETHTTTWGKIRVSDHNLMLPMRVVSNTISLFENSLVVFIITNEE